MKTMYNLNVITTQFLAYGTERVKGGVNGHCGVYGILRTVNSFLWNEEQTRSMLSKKSLMLSLANCGRK